MLRTWWDVALNKKNLKEKLLGRFGSAAGLSSIASAHNVCHNLCIAAVALLSVFGVAANSNILMFLEDYNILFWSMGAFFLAISTVLYHFRPHCISEKLIIANAGLLAIGFPFLPQMSVFFWTTGGVLVSGAAFFYTKENMNFNLMKSVSISIAIAIAIATLYAISPSASTLAVEGSGSLVQDKCTPQPGYTEQEWREHMSHHSDIYKECLNK